LAKKAFIYGFHAVHASLLRQAEKIQVLMVDPKRHDARMQELIKLAEQHGVKLQLQSRLELNSLANTHHHQGVLAFITPSIPQNLESFLDSLPNPFLLVLDGIQDPHNLGACLRTANAAGLDAVIAPKDRATGITPAVTKVACGATLQTPFFQVTNLARTLKGLKEKGIWLYGASEHAESLYSELTYSGAIAVVMGSEGQGLRRLTKSHCDFMVRIPMSGMVPSLNISVATGILLYEIRRQLKRSPPS
jgi:23S rRNA (guanosine2251-2'-O)-methyltransferase